MSAVVKTETKHQSSNGTSLFNEYDDIELTIRILLNSREVGNVIGKGGKTVKNIRNQSGARVVISNVTTLERIVFITGNRNAICKAIELIGLKVEEFFERLNGNWIGPKIPLTFKLIVPTSQCGFIIGKNGSKVKEMRDSSRAVIIVGSDTLPNSTERLVSITGTTGTISHCVYLVCNVLLDSSLHYASTRYHPCNKISDFPTCRVIKDLELERNIPLTNHGLGTASNKVINQAGLTALAGSQLRASNHLHNNVSGEQFDNNSNSTIETITINVPNNLIGCIIGRRGSKIAEIRRISGATVHIFQSQGTIENRENEDRRVTIIGKKESVAVAKYLVEMSVILQKANLGEVELSSSPDDGSILTSSTPTEAQPFAKPDPITVLSKVHAFIALIRAIKTPPVLTTGVHRSKNCLKRKQSPSMEKAKVQRSKFTHY